MNSTSLAPNLTSQTPELPKPRKEYTGVAGRILRFMCGGATAIQAANACGVSESYVSQLASEESFQSQIAEKLSKDFEVAAQIDENYQEIEKLLSKRLRDVTSYMTNVDQITRTLKTVSAIPKKVQPKVPLNSETGGGAVTPVSLAIPIVAKNVFIVNPNSEIVSLNGKELTTLNSKSLDSLLSEKRERVTIEQAKPEILGVKERKNGKQRVSSEDYSDL